MARYPYREVIELYSTGMSIMKVAYLCGTGTHKTHKVLSEAKRLGIGWPVPAELGDDELEQLVDPHENARRCLPDFPAIAKALGEKRLKPKRAQEAYDLYLKMCRESENEPYSFIMFVAYMRKWDKVNKTKPSMLINWHPGEEVQVDWAGRTLWLYGPDGKKAPAFLFVGTLPYTDLTFIRASLDMGMQTWLEHHMHMFEYFGGVPIFVGIDNLATGVTFHRDGTRTVHTHYRDLADHYGAIVVPGRVKTPTDKGSVEGHVKIMSNAIVSILEGMRFQTIDQLNDTIAALLEVFNGRPSAALHSISRREAFEAWEREALQPLPEEPYSPVTWKKHVVSQDNVLRVRGNYYSVPGGYGNEKLWVRISKTRVDVYDIRKAQRLATHSRKMDGEKTFEGLPFMRPDRLQPLADYARANDRPLLMMQWDAERNEGLSPERIVCRSEKKVWWRCPTCGYAWRDSILVRTRRKFDDCPMCAGLVLVKGVNDLATTHPRIAAEWDDERNPLQADEVFPDWRMRVWWKGECGHSWCAPVVQRTSSAKGALCPYCSGKKALTGFNDVATLAPELAYRWHPSKNRNNLPETTSAFTSSHAYFWDGPLSMIWRASVRSQVDESTLKPIRQAEQEEWALPGFKLDLSRASVKWWRFYEQAGLLGISLRDFCEWFDHPELIEQWDDELNAPLTPDDVRWSEQRQVWWTDSSCGHTWLARVYRRVWSDNGCVYCGRVRILAGYSTLRSTSARSVKNWHPTRNEPMTLDTVTDRSGKTAWWRCPDCGYEWREALGTPWDWAHACPVCTKRPFYLRPGENDILYAHPYIAELFAEDLNEGVDIARVFAKSKKRYWWRCEFGHVWQARVDTMVKYKGTESKRCPYCAGRKLLRGFNDLETLVPEAVALWHPTRNGDLRPSDVTTVSSKRVWWKCKCGHEWQAEVESVAIRGTRCPRCANRAVVAGVNDFATLEPELAKQWHPTLNGDLKPSDVVPGSNKLVWWQCSKGHEWQRIISCHTRKYAECPICAMGLLAVGVNDLVTMHPKLAAQWDEDLNGELRPTDVMPNSNRRVWWRCERGHTWQHRIRNRVNHDTGCPYCENRKVLPGFNDLATVRPDMAAQWYYESNWPLKPTDVTATSTKKVWWKMDDCGHVFFLRVCRRARNKELTCPYCTGHLKIERPLR